MGDSYRLPTNCRNTRSISETCSDILKKEIVTHPQAPEGVSTEFLTEKSYKIPSVLDSMVKKWVTRDKIKPSQIVILSPNRFKHSCLNGLTAVGGQKLTRETSEWRQGGGVLFSTIRSFKGLEADIVMLVDVVEPGSVEHFSSSDLYVACSRAKHILKIVSEKSVKELLV
jgi:DNA helicase IV